MSLAAFYSGSVVVQGYKMLIVGGRNSVAEQPLVRGLGRVWHA